MSVIIEIEPIAEVIGGHTTPSDDFQGGVESIIRNHRRPNQLAISHPRLLGVDGRDLLVTDLDAVNGTPVLDLAPYFPTMGPQGAVHVPNWVNEMLAAYWSSVTAQR